MGEVLRGVLRDHAPLVDDHDAPAGHRDLREDVRGEHDRVLAAEALDQLARLDDLLGIEARGRLVEDEDVRVVEDGLGEAHALAISLGEAGPMRVWRTSAMRVFSITSAILALRSLPGDALDLGAEVEERAHVHVRVEGRRLRGVARRGA
jgi:hypothetical protein